MSLLTTDVSAWQEIISGKNSGGLARLFRVGLWGLSCPYRVVTAVRNLMFDYRLMSVRRVPARVISVGNLTAGGTGKTPTVAWIVRSLLDAGQRPAIISRGYAGQGGENDEKRVLDQLLPGVSHIQNPDRVAAARSLLGSETTNVPTHLVLDDAFQHRRIARDVDLVLIDALNPWGYGCLLPRGLLREPLSSLRRASAVLISRSDLVDNDQRRMISQRIREVTEAPLLWGRFVPTGMRNHEGRTMSLSESRRFHWAAFCGIGNPDGFQRTLASCGLAVGEDRFRRFPDHHHYRGEDLTELESWAPSTGVQGLITTHKDLVKIPRSSLGQLPLWALDIELQLDSDQADELRDLLLGKRSEPG